MLCMCVLGHVCCNLCASCTSQCMHCVYKPNLCVFRVTCSSCTWYADSLIIVIVHFAFELQVVSPYMAHAGLSHTSCVGEHMLCLCRMCTLWMRYNHISCVCALSVHLVSVCFARVLHVLSLCMATACLSLLWRVCMHVDLCV